MGHFDNLECSLQTFPSELPPTLKFAPSKPPPQKPQMNILFAPK